MKIYLHELIDIRGQVVSVAAIGPMRKMPVEAAEGPTAFAEKREPRWQT